MIKIDSSDLARLNSTMRRYQEASGKSFESILAQEGRQICFGMYGEFKKLSPKPSTILKQAKERRWRTGRYGNKLTPAVGTYVSTAADRRAQNYLGGQKSDYFRIEQTGDGIIRVLPVRFSAASKSKRVTKLATILGGGRSGRRFSAAARRSSQVGAFELSRALKAAGNIKRLNLGALSAANEIALRQRAAKGGTLAVQWLPSVYKKRKSAMIKSGPLVVNSPTGYQLGRVDFETQNQRLNGIVISANAPGTAKVMQRAGVFQKVIAARIADREKYISDKLKEAKAEGFKR